ncbi:type III secretion system effector BopA family protein [Chromobacterium piscinae]|uniref:Effector protein BopA n=1 Tax=Chromobacterium piscinae TaxID=686831 RepID=A0ABV0HA32_9NEIS
MIYSPSLNAFRATASTQGQEDQRLLVNTSEGSSSIQIAKEGLGGRILSYLGKWPIFHRIDAVKTHVETIQTQNKAALEAFVSALSQDQNYDGMAVSSIKQRLLPDLTTGAKPLTPRVIKQMESFATECQSKKEYLSELSERYGDKIAKQAFALQGLMTPDRHDKDYGGFWSEKPLEEAVKNTLSEQVDQIEKIVVGDALRGIAKASSLTMLNGSSLRNNYKTLASTSGALRSLLIGLDGLAAIKGLTGAAEFVQTLKNVQIGGIPFSEWGTPGGQVETWLKTATPDQLEQAAKQIRHIAHDVKCLSTDAKQYLDGVPRSQFDLARFSNASVPVTTDTQVHLADGCLMPVSRVAINGQAVALAGSYPKSSLEALSAHLRMLAEQRCSSLVVLAGHDQIASKGLPDYFAEGTRTYGDVTITSKTPPGGRFLIGDKGDPQALKAHRYQLTIRVPGSEPFSLPVLHVTNWGDHQPLKDSAQLEQLARQVQTIDHEGGLQNEPIHDTLSSQLGLPMIHCLGGVGRTGTLIGALQVLKNPTAQVDDIVTDMRATRNPRMAEDEAQRSQLKEMASRLRPREDSVYANVTTV